MCWRRPRALLAQALASACADLPRAGRSPRTAPVIGGLWRNLREKSRALRSRRRPDGGTGNRAPQSSTGGRASAVAQAARLLRPAADPRVSGLALRLTSTPHSTSCGSSPAVVWRTVRACQERDAVAGWTLTGSNQADVGFTSIDGGGPRSAGKLLVQASLHQRKLSCRLRVSIWLKENPPSIAPLWATSCTRGLSGS
jgi:hypothetical protein